MLKQLIQNKPHSVAGWLGIILIVLGLFVRIYQFGTVPPSLDWDEVSLAYNALALWHTGEDEYGNHLPFSIRSFNDYKPPLYAYTLAPFVGLFGRSDLVVRLPALIFGLLGLLIVFLLTKHFLASKDNPDLAYLVTGTLATMPWHVMLSRAGFEAGLGVTLMLLMLYFALWWRRTGLLVLAISAGLSGVLAMYAYHAPRLLIPMMVVIMVIAWFRHILLKWKQVVLVLIMVMAGLLPLAVISTRGAVGSRFETVSIFTNPGEFSRERELSERMSEYYSASILAKPWYSTPMTSLRIIARNYMDHFSADFLVVTGDGNARHSLPGFGMLTWYHLVGFLIGLTHLSKKHWWLVAGLLLAPIPASMTADTPHAIRAFGMAPFVAIISGMGLLAILGSARTVRGKFVSVGLSALVILTTLVMSNILFTSYSTLAARDWQYGYRQVVAWLSQHPDKAVYMTNHYDQPHIYVAWYQPVNVRDYQAQADTAHQTLGRYTFGPATRENIDSFDGFVVVEPERALEGQNPMHIIRFIDGTSAFMIYNQSL